MGLFRRFLAGVYPKPGYKLRAKFDQLTAKMEAQTEKANAPEKWKSPAVRRVEANMAAGEEAERLLFGNAAPATSEVTYDAS